MVGTPARSLRRLPSRGVWSTGVLVGLAGGAAEVGWIALYERLSTGEAAAVARGVTDTLFPKFAAASLAIPLGLAIHMALAVLLGLAIAALLPALLPRARGTALEPVAVTGLLIAVWAANFFIVLPAINPAFVELVPYGASLTSKVLFGLAAALVLQVRDRPCPAAKRA